MNEISKFTMFVKENVDEAFQEHIEGTIKRVSGKFTYYANYSYKTKRFEGFVDIDGKEYPVQGKTRDGFIENAHYRVKTTLSD